MITIDQVQQMLLENFQRVAGQNNTTIEETVFDIMLASHQNFKIQCNFEIVILDVSKAVEVVKGNIDFLRRMFVTEAKVNEVINEYVVNSLKRLAEKNKIGLKLVNVAMSVKNGNFNLMLRSAFDDVSPITIDELFEINK